ncbi:uncharacterized protein LOC112552631 [Pogonomyrmex barbatus]|uniref:Uncharacterized protein LOC112552631 n=1 Tax=Pogonomyrmex barbatus TaxID=144034 RepID=A0A8N1S5E4_9HYME|nr:uncharacterized protein LOC112552631 [Pogonomyrmex barbatus]
MPPFLVLFFLVTEKNKENDSSVLEIKYISNSEAYLDESILEVMGEDPKSQALELDIHPTFLKKWRFWTVNGVPETEKDKLLKKYVRSLQFEAPSLNPEIAASLGEYACKRFYGEDILGGCIFLNSDS